MTKNEKRIFEFRVQNLLMEIWKCYCRKCMIAAEKEIRKAMKK